MRYKFLLLLSLLCIISCKGHDSKDTKLVESATIKKKEVSFPITYRWQSEDKSQEFTIKILKITQDSLFAQYCAVYNNRQKLDCDFNNNINIKTVFNKNKNEYTGNFESFFKSEIGKCLIKITDEILTWEILKIPDGEYYAPNKCILKKESIKNIKKENDNSSNSVLLPFDYQSYEHSCTQENSSDCQKKYPTLNKSEYNKVLKIIGIQEGYPESIFLIKTILNDKVKVYILNFEGDSSSQEIVTIENNKVISTVSLGYAMPEQETYDTFIINTDMTIDIFEINFTNSLNKKLKERYKILANGLISKI